MTNFWKWVFKGVESAPPGYKSIVNAYLFFHVLIALIAQTLIKSDPFIFAGKALFPAASILIGMSMAWTTRASTILQSKELRSALFSADRPAEDYVYGFQLAILIIIIMVTYVSIMAGGGFNLSVLGNPIDQYASGFWMYLLLSISLRARSEIKLSGISRLA